MAPYLPTDHARQMTAEKLALETWSESTHRVLDLGCGDGASIDLFRSIALRFGTEIDWRGVDIEGSPEVGSRERTDGVFDTFDGVNLPYENESFDAVYSDQVLEHVRHPDALIGEVARVLKPGGLFIGTASYLEPYHSSSIFNFTPYGLVQVIEGNGLRVDALRPCVDGLTMIWRQLLFRPFFFRWFIDRVSPLNFFFSGFCRLFRLEPKIENYLKIQFSGQICFTARRAGKT